LLFEIHILERKEDLKNQIEQKASIHRLFILFDQNVDENDETKINTVDIRQSSGDFTLRPISDIMFEFSSDKHNVVLIQKNSTVFTNNLERFLYEYLMFIENSIES